MALIRSAISMVLAAGVLSACGTLGADDPLRLAGSAIGAAISRSEPSQLTATRAGLLESGFDEPLLVASIRKPVEIKAGLLRVAQPQGISFWSGADGSTVKTDQGVLAGTVSVNYDLYSAQTTGTLAALQGDRSTPYPRVYRHLNALNQLDLTRFFCQMSDPVPETIVVFDRQHQTLRFTESCITERPGPTGVATEIENTYWKDPNRLFLWRSDQWMGEKSGYILLERVFE
ncbi:YjbF family lipoprotein [Aestuariivita sp.]|uniref:YjbF family lipoprotein n=1 Tax=Aestuariivita sp. TaxID=1872407 RepID=UPI0021704B0C|nr:YjbF family lipoprotein [Aestuariivita sp.]MCE8005550.1 YjbF family lipoprotein [Aestuariivita sp.]